MKEYFCTEMLCVVALERESGIDTGFTPKDCRDCIYSVEVELEEDEKEEKEE